MAAVIRTYFKQYTSPEMESISQNTHVDNIIYLKQILKHFQLLKLVFNNTKMNIKQFTTNSDYGCKVISKEDRNESDEISVLGTY